MHRLTFFFFLNILFILAKHRYIRDRSSLNHQRKENITWLSGLMFGNSQCSLLNTNMDHWEQAFGNAITNIVLSFV